MRMLHKKTLGSASFYIALLLMVFIFSNILISSLLFVLHITISPLQPILASLATATTGAFILRRCDWRTITGITAVVIVAILTSIYITSVTSDDTVDTHGYHQTAVGAMRYGWNPLYEDIGDFNESGKSPIRLQNDYYEKWDNHYPKAHWIYAANIYSVTGAIETGRSMVLLVITILFFLVLHYALTRFSLGLSFVLGSLAAFNPISAMQMFSYYNDGMLGNLLLMTILLLTMVLDKKYTSFSLPHYALIVMALSVLVNLKFTGPAYAGVYCFVYFGYIVANKNYRKKYARPLFITGVAAVAVAVFIVGLSTYPKNLLEKGSPFYPLMGGDSEIDIITENEPYTFHEMNNVEKFVTSNFSRTDNISESSGRDPAIKIPFTFSIDELTYLSFVDPRIAGYGVWFGGILLASIGWLVYMAIKLLRQKDWDKLWLMILPLAPTAFIVLALPESWWARYVPQMFLVPAVALVSMLLMRKFYFANILTFLLVVNTILIINFQLDGQRLGLKYRESEEKAVDALLENGKHTPKVYLGVFGGLAYRYYEKYGDVIILAEEQKDAQPESYLKLAKDIIVYK